MILSDYTARYNLCSDHVHWEHLPNSGTHKFKTHKTTFQIGKAPTALKTETVSGHPYMRI